MDGGFEFFFASDYWAKFALVVVDSGYFQIVLSSYQGLLSSACATRRVRAVRAYKSGVILSGEICTDIGKDR